VGNRVMGILAVALSLNIVSLCAYGFYLSRGCTLNATLPRKVLAVGIGSTAIGIAASLVVILRFGAESMTVLESRILLTCVLLAIIGPWVASWLFPETHLSVLRYSVLNVAELQAWDRRRIRFASLLWRVFGLWLFICATLALVVIPWLYQL
jgi:hypothetical protein